MKDIYLAVTCAAVAIGCVLGAVLLHKAEVDKWKARAAEAQIRTLEVQEAFDAYRYKLVQQTARILETNAQAGNAALDHREAAHEAIRNTAGSVQQVIASQTPESGAVDLDLPLPDGLSRGLVRMHQTAAGCAGAGDSCALPSPGAVPGKGPASSAGSLHDPHPGGLDGKASGVGR